MSSAYLNIFNCYLPTFIPLGTIFILCITFCNAKLNSIGDKGSPCFRPVLFKKKNFSVSSILTALLVFCTHYFQCKYVVNYRSSISKSILIVPHNFFYIWFNFSQYYIRQNFLSCISHCYSPVILTPFSVSSFVYRNYYCFCPFLRYPFLLPDLS